MKKTKIFLLVILLAVFYSCEESTRQKQNERFWEEIREESRKEEEERMRELNKPLLKLPDFDFKLDTQELNKMSEEFLKDNPIELMPIKKETEKKETNDTTEFSNKKTFETDSLSKK